VLDKLEGPCVRQVVEKSSNVRIEHPVHSLPLYTHGQRIQRLMRAATRPEPSLTLLLSCTKAPRRLSVPARRKAFSRESRLCAGHQLWEVKFRNLFDSNQTRPLKANGSKELPAHQGQIDHVPVCLNLR
jgi:hypothetical protein